MTPFEIRLELLKMAQSTLTEEYYIKKNQAEMQWNMDCETARTKGMDPPKFTFSDTIPNEKDIIAKATAFNVFISNTPVENVSKAKK